MYAGTLLLTSLLWTTGAVPEPSYLNTRSFQIPVRLNPAKIAGVKEVELFVSTDQGRTWTPTSAMAPDGKDFHYVAPTDGTYWFGVALMYPNGTRVPADLSKLASAGPRVVVVDTIKPMPQVTATRKGNDVLVHWDINEANPDLSSLRLEYHFADGLMSQWYTATIDRPAMNGQTTISVKNPAAMTVRLQIQDRATNSATATAEVPAAPPSMTVAQAPPTPAGPALGTSPAASAGPSFGSNSVTPAFNPAPPAHSFWDNGHTTGEAIPVSRREVRPEPLAPVISPADRTPYVPPPRNLTPPASGYGSLNNRQWLASSDGSASAPAPAPTMAPAAGGLPPIQFVKNPRVTLEYETRKVGPSGLGVVELWLTHDDGQTWNKYADDQHPNPKSPSITVDLRDGDKIYGFTLIVRSGVNKGRLQPMPGEAPEMRIELDSSAPEAKLAPPEQDPQHRDMLLLKWLVHDRNMEPDGVSLYWSEIHDGPWKPIAENLSPAQGQYGWTPTAVPYYVYLRLTARDKAGNLTEVISDSPVAIDMTVPEVRLKRVLPATAAFAAGR